MDGVLIRLNLWLPMSPARMARGEMEEKGWAGLQSIMYVCTCKNNVVVNLKKENYL